jgi:hypothetical protein
MMDFFVPGVDYHDFKLGGGDPKRQQSRASLKAADVSETLSRVKQSISAEHVHKIKAVFEFILKGKGVSWDEFLIEKQVYHRFFSTFYAFLPEILNNCIAIFHFQNRILYLHRKTFLSIKFLLG